MCDNLTVNIKLHKFSGCEFSHIMENRSKWRKAHPSVMVNEE